MRFSAGDEVRWTSQSAGTTKIKEGVIVKGVLAGKGMNDKDMAWKRLTKVPKIGTYVRIIEDGKQYTGKIFCTPYLWREGEIGENALHFAIEVDAGPLKGQTPVFDVKSCEIWVQDDK